MECCDGTGQAAHHVRPDVQGEQTNGREDRSPAVFLEPGVARPGPMMHRWQQQPN